MAEYDGEIRIKATIDTDEFDKKASNLTKKLYSQNNALKRQQYILSELNQKYSDIVNKITKTAEETSLEKSLKRAEKGLSLFQKQYNEALSKSQTLNLVKKAYNREGVELPPDYEADLKKAESEVLKFKGQIESSNLEVRKLQKELEKVRLNPENTKSAKDLQYKISLAQEKAGNLRDKIHETSEELNKIRLGKVSKMEESFKRLSDTLKSKFQGISSLFGRTFSATISSVSSPLRSLIRGFERLSRRILRLSGLVLVFNSVRSSLRGLRDYLGGVLQTNDIFVKSLGQIKSNLITAFYPVYQYILPALNALMGTLVKASAYLAQFMSMIFGKSAHESQKGAKSLNDQILAVKNQKKSYDELGKSVRKAKGELASFDKLIVLSQNNQKKPKSPTDNGFVFSPTTSFDNNFNTISNIFNVMREKIKPTVEAFKNLGETINNTFGSFAVTLGKDFYNEFLKPLGEWTLGKGLPEFARITKDMFKNIDFDKLNTKFKDLFKALEPFSETIGEGLLWFYENVLTKLGTWTMNEILPRFLDILSKSLEAIKPVVDQVGEDLKWLWDNFLKPASEWVGEQITKFLDKLSDAIQYLGDKIKNNKLLLEFISGFLIGLGSVALAAALGAVATSLWGVVTATVAWTTALLANPITWIVAGIAALIAIIIVCVKHWDEIKEASVKAWDKMKEAWGKIGQWFDEKVLQPLKNIWDNIERSWKSGINGIIGIFENFINRIIGGVNMLTSILSKVQFDMPDWLGGGHFGVNMPRISNVSIPRLAQGAVLRGGNPMIAYLNDQPKGQINIETPLKTMIDAFEESLRRNGNNQGNVTIEASGDIGKLVSFLNFKLKQENQRIGNNLVTGDVFI